MTNETTPDAVERAKLLRSALCAAASDADEIRATLLAERARHADRRAHDPVEVCDRCGRPRGNHNARHMFVARKATS